MKVILTRNVPGRGRKGELVEVSDAYARNALLPHRIAVIADRVTINRQADLRSKQSRHEHHIQQQLTRAKERCQGISVTLSAEANEQGRLFAAVKPDTILEALCRQLNERLPGVSIDSPPIKTLGTTVVTVRWPDESTSPLSLEVTHAK